MFPRSSRSDRTTRPRRIPTVSSSWPPVPVRLGLAAMLALSLSCAAPAELSRRSESALAAGNDQQAWEWAERAMRADPDLPRARAAMTAAAMRAVPDWQTRIRNLAQADTVAAARLSLEFGEIRARLGGWGIPAPIDSAYLDAQSLIRHAAATRLYDQGLELQHDGRSREAYRSFTSAGEIVPGFRDVDERAHRSFELGVTRIAVLPFEDDTGVPGLSEELASYVYHQLATNLPQKKYPFVRFVPEEAIAGRVRAEGRITREAAIRIGRSVGANRVLWGRLSGLHSDTRTDTWHDRVFRKVAVRDSNRSRIRYDEMDVETVSRERSIQVAWAFEVIETDEERAVAGRTGTEQVEAHAVYTRFDPEGDCDDYLLAPPEWKSDRASAWKAAHDGWKNRFGDWNVSDFLEAARGARGHDHYRRVDRESYLSPSRPRVSDDLPPAGDLAFLALRGVASPAWEAFKALEREPAP